MENKFKIIKKLIDGIENIGFVIIDNENNEKIIKYEDAVRLCKSGLIDNADIVLDYNSCEYIIELKDIVENTYKIKTDNKFNIVGRIIDTIDNEDICIGYIVKDINGKAHKIEISKAWRLACNNSINNVKAYIINNKKVIESVEDFDLSRVPCIRQ